MRGSEIVGTLVLTVLMALAVMSGLGGGGIIVAILMISYQLETKSAISVSGFTIFTGSVARFIATRNQRHPDKDATCIDYGISNIMMPLVLTGSNVGVYFNMIFPDIITLGCLTALLMFLFQNSTKKFLQIYKKETIELAA